jgi:AraC family transcriptional regulator, transcriptional activator of pobA
MKQIPVRHIPPKHKETDLSGNFSILDLQAVLSEKDVAEELHRHTYFFLLVLKTGKGHHTIDFTPYEVDDRTVFFLRPGQVHQLSLEAGTTGYLLEFNTEFYFPNDPAAVQLLRRASSKNWCRPDAGRMEELYAPLAAILREYNHKQQGYLDVIKANLSIFFIGLVRHRQHDEGPLDTAKHYAQERIEELSELLREHIAEHKQVSYYADRLHLSPYRLNALTKATLGKTCSGLIDEHILLESKRYLLATSNQVKEIAYHLGYEDVSYFIRFFKKHTGYSPEGFRQHYR